MPTDLPPTTRRDAWLVVGALLILALGWGDHATGYDYGWSLMYLTPVSLAGWYLGRRRAVALALLAVGCWLWADIASREAPVLAVSLWNGLTRLVIYVGAAIAVNLIRADRNRLHALLEREAELANTDSLTGLANGRAFRTLLGHDFARGKRSDTPVCLLYFDIDNFKRINDQHGHAEGDAVLIEIAGVMKGSLRGSDHAARLGGDEFGMLLWDATAEAGERVAHRVIDGVRKIGERYPGSGLGASAGAVDTTEGIDTPERLVAEADRAMYELKMANKGTVRRSLRPVAE